MPGKCRPSLLHKTLENVMRSNLSNTDKECIKTVFDRCEAEPVKHGRWVDRSCTYCGYNKETRARNYCPNCGAKMDGDTPC